MFDFLYSLDRSVFWLLNHTISNPLLDVSMPVLTDLNKTWWGLTLFGLAWLLLVWKGERKGMVVGIFLIPLIFMSDQLSSAVIKKLVERARPCHTVEGSVVVANLRLLVDCGSGFSFPSTHAVNNFAVATFVAYFFRRWAWALFAFAGMVGFSRIYVGVHYPSDIAGGAIIGMFFAVVMIAVWRLFALSFSPLRLDELTRELEKE